MKSKRTSAVPTKNTIYATVAEPHKYLAACISSAIMENRMISFTQALQLRSPHNMQHRRRPPKKDLKLTK